MHSNRLQSTSRAARKIDAVCGHHNTYLYFLISIVLLNALHETPFERKSYMTLYLQTSVIFVTGDFFY